MRIQENSSSDLDDVLRVEREAFERDDVVNLARDLLNDPSAEPVLSLLAMDNGRAVGHILFSRARVSGSQCQAAILAPLAIVPDAQKQGIGGQLIREGLRRLADSGSDVVFVLGHPGYYRRHGFGPALAQGFEAPYPIPEKDSDAWMVQALRPDVIGSVRGKVICADALDSPEHWRE